MNTSGEKDRMAAKQKRSVLIYYGIAMVLLIISLFFDKQLISLLAQLRTAVIDNLFVWSSRIFSKTLIFTIALVLMIVKARKLLIRFVAASCVSLVIVYVLKFLVTRARPYLELNLPKLIESTSQSFPSGHTAIAFATLPFVFSTYKNSFIGWLWCAIVIIIAFSRLYLGVHYLSDVIAGAVIGFGISHFFLKFK